MRQNIIFSTLAVAVAPAAAMAAPVRYMSDKGVAIAVTGGPEQEVFRSSTVQLPQTNEDDKFGLRAFYLTYDFANSNLPTGTKVESITVIYCFPKEKLAQKVAFGQLRLRLSSFLTISPRVPR